MRSSIIKTFFILGMAFFMVSTISAQDIIKRIDGKSIECKIIRLGEDKVVYYPYGLENPPEISIDMDLVQKVTFETGYQYEHSTIKEAKIFLYQETYRNALKLDFFSPIGGTTKLTYERLYDHKNSGEFSILIHGVGMNNNYEANGIGFELGHKFPMSTGLFTNSDQVNALSGFYFKPELLIGMLSYKYETYDYRTGREISTKLTEPYFGVFLNAGAQFVINNIFIIDMYIGLGPTYYSEKHADLTGGDSYSDFHMLPVGGGNWVNESNFGLKGGIKLGFAFGDKLDARRIVKSK